MPFNLIAFPDQAKEENAGAVQLPDVLSLLVTHSLNGTVPGIDALERQAQRRVENGIPAVQALQALSKDPKDAAALAQFDAHRADLGYGFLVQRYAPDLSQVSAAQVSQAARDSIPPVAGVFWSFRLMVGFGLLMLAFFVIAVWYSMRNKIQQITWLLKLALWMIPVPFLADEAGWLVAELGRQPWTVFGVLPTWMSASTHSVTYLAFSLIGFVALYSVLIVIEMYLMVRAIRLGPAEHDPKGPLARQRPSLAGHAAGAAAHATRGEG